MTARLLLIGCLLGLLPACSNTVHYEPDTQRFGALGLDQVKWRLEQLMRAASEPQISEVEVGDFALRYRSPAPQELRLTEVARATIDRQTHRLSLVDATGQELAGWTWTTRQQAAECADLVMSMVSRARRLGAGDGPLRPDTGPN